MGDAVLADRTVDLVEVGDVATDERHPLERVRRHDELEPGGIVTEVEPHDGAPSSASTLHVQAPRQPSAPVTRNRSATSDVLVDRDDLGVELDRSAALLVRAEARALDPAERDVDVGAGRLRVDCMMPASIVWRTFWPPRGST